MQKKLLLWDIDGTLFLGDGVGKIALLAALRREFGIAGSMQGIEMGGRTDQRIVSNLLAAHDIEPTATAVHRIFEAYVVELERILPTRSAALLPGVVEALEAVAAREDLVQGLLTGNITKGAELKLAHFNAWHYFEFGAFGEDSADRNDLAHRAIENARRHHGLDFSPKRTWVIGDTPHDIACGKAIGANTIALATGFHDYDTLAALDPTALLPDLKETEAFLAILDAPASGNDPG